MAGVTTTVTVDAVDTIAMLRTAGLKMPAVVLEQLGIVSEFVKQAMKAKAPVGVGGDRGLRGSIDFKIDPGTMSSEVKPLADYGDAVETGSRPHWISAKPGSTLAQWAQLKGINPYAVQKSIAIHGTKAHPFIQPTYVDVAPLVPEKFAAGIARFIGGLNGL